jgi:hypothetical protein
MICCRGSLTGQADLFQAQPSFHVQTDFVQVPVGVADKNGRNVDGLVARGFAALDEGFPLEANLDALGPAAKTRAARGYSGPPEVGQELALFEIGDSIAILHCPPSLAAVKNGSYQSRISVGDTVIAWGSGFTVAGNRLIFTPASGSGQSVVLGETDGLYFWDQSTGQINAALPPSVTAGQWDVLVRNDCIVPTGAQLVTVN